MGRVNIDYILKDAWVYMTYLKRFEKQDIAVTGEKFYAISPVLQYEGVQSIDCRGKYIVPGLIDIHMHIESSMTYPKEFSRVVLPYGVTTVVADPHEIANVFGIEGIRSFMNEDTKLDIFYGIPSSVPSTNDKMETSGGKIAEKEVQKLLEDDRILCLGEVMNFKDLSSDYDTLIKRVIRKCREHGKVKIEGHCPKLTGEDLQKFIFAGVDADHTQQTPKSVLEKIKLGMFMELQMKSLTREVIDIIKEYNLYEYIALVTDDTMPDDLMHGQLNRIVKHAVDMGMPLEMALYCSTYTPARRMHLDDRGVIAPGKIADFVIYNDISGMIPYKVYKNGNLVDMDEAFIDKMEFPSHFYQSVNCDRADIETFQLRTDVQGKVKAHIIKTVEFGNSTKHEVMNLKVENGMVCWKEAGLCLAAVFNRYEKGKPVSLGLVDCKMTEEGAVACTWSHDSHNIFVLGNSIEDMVKAQNAVIDMQGGYVTSSGGKITAAVPLKIGGIISDEPLEKLASDLKKVRNEIERMGYKNNNVIMSISTLCLLVSPELKISNKGLFDVKTQKRVPLLEEVKENE